MRWKPGIEGISLVQKIREINLPLFLSPTHIHFHATNIRGLTFVTHGGALVIWISMGVCKEFKTVEETGGWFGQGDTLDRASVTTAQQ